MCSEVGESGRGEGREGRGEGEGEKGKGRGIEGRCVVESGKERRW